MPLDDFRSTPTAAPQSDSFGSVALSPSPAANNGHSAQSIFSSTSSDFIAGSQQPEHQNMASKDGEWEKRSPLLQNMIAGGLGGTTGDMLMHSLDTVKTRQQGDPHFPPKYSSLGSSYYTIWRQEGIRRGLYGGWLPAMLGSFPGTVLFFGSYEWSKRVMLDYNIQPHIAYLTAGAIGDFAASIVYVPSEVLKTRLQLQGRHNNPYFKSGYNYKSTFDAVKTIVRVEGPSTLFHGYSATLYRDLPFSALQFMFYEQFQSWARQWKRSREIGTPLEILTGAAGGGLAGVITCPLDVVKTRLQTQIEPAPPPAAKERTAAESKSAAKPTHPKAAPPSHEQHRLISTSSPSTHTPRPGATTLDTSSVFKGLRMIYKTEGIGGWFRGVGPRGVWTSVQSGYPCATTMSPPLPVPSKAAIHALRGLAFGTSCAIGLIVDDRRRRISTLRTAIENKKKLKSSRLYHGTADAVALPVDDPVLLHSDDLHWHYRPDQISSLEERRLEDNSYSAQTSPGQSSPQPSSQSEAVESQKTTSTRTATRQGSRRDAGPTRYSVEPLRKLSSLSTSFDVPVGRDSGGWMRGSAPQNEDLPKADPTLVINDILDSLEKDEHSLDRIIGDFLQQVQSKSLLAQLGDRWCDLSIALCKHCQEKGRWDGAQRVLAASVQSGWLGMTQYWAHDPIPVIESALPSADLASDRSERAKALGMLRLSVQLFTPHFKDNVSMLSPELPPLGKTLVERVLAFNQPQYVREIYGRVLPQLADATEFTAMVISALFEYRDHKSVLQLFRANFSKCRPDQQCFSDIVEMAVNSVEHMAGARANSVIRALASLCRSSNQTLKTSWLMRILQAHWGRLGDLKKSQALFDQMLKEGLLDQVAYPQYVYKVMAEISVMSGDIGAARHYRNEVIMMTPAMAKDVGLMGYFAFAKAQAGDWDGVLSDFAKMKLHRETQSEAYQQSFIRILKVFAQDHPIAEVEQFVQYYIQEMHMQLHPFMVSLVANSYGEFHDAPGLIRWLQFCSSSGFALSPSFVNAVLRNCRLKWKLPFRQLRKLFSEMRRLQGTSVDDVTQNMMHNAALMDGNYFGRPARQRVRSLKLSLSRKPYYARSANNRQVFAAMQEEVQCGRPNMAVYIYKRALQYGMAWCPHCFRIAVIASLKQKTGNFEKAMRLITSTSKQGHDVGIAVGLYIKAQLDFFRGTFEEIMDRLKAMIVHFESAGIVINPSVLTHAAVIAAKSGRDAQAVSLCQVAMQRGGTTNPCFTTQSLRALLMAYYHLMDVDGLQWVVESLSSSPCSADVRALALLKETRRHMRKWETTDRVCSMKDVLEAGIDGIKQRRVLQIREGAKIQKECLSIMSDAVAKMEAGKPYREAEVVAETLGPTYNNLPIRQVAVEG
ncbi:mitochondrial carrier [Apiospora rasikravindrae]|uniref:Mitochondrial carrier n=1 Tax=Apiospora rasikravindrae TaxID=990691 RepID=A0ABR1TXQ3_9PEZI